MPKGRNLVDDEIDAWDYADQYVEEQAWKEKKRIAKESGEGVDEMPVAVTKPKAAAPKLKAPAPPPPPPPPAEEALEEEPILEAVDDWEAAMDALEAHVSKQEEIRAKEATQKGGKK